MTVGQRIAQKRKELGLSQETLGEQLGVSRQAIYKWESDATLPEIEKLIREYMLTQSKIEKANTDSGDRASDATATMLADFSDYALGETATPFTRNLFYAIGKWIYLIDALDDYDKDKKKDAYNPFLLAYQAPSREELVNGKTAEEVKFVFHAIFFDIRENLSQISFKFNRDLSDNILLRGLPATTKRVMEGKNCKADKRE